MYMLVLFLLFESMFFENTYSINKLNEIHSYMNVGSKTSSKYVDNVLET